MEDKSGDKIGDKVVDQLLKAEAEANKIIEEAMAKRFKNQTIFEN